MKSTSFFYLYLYQYKIIVMKRLIILLLPVLFSMGVVAQGNKPVKEKNKSVKVKNSEGEKGKKEKQDELEKGNRSHDDIIWEGTSKPGGKGPKFSKNQPAKVRAAFQRDYPGATNVRWSKYRGDWTATFGNGIFTSTAVYHANGDRRDTRTPVVRRDLPVKIEDIFKKKPATQLGDIIKIEVPQGIKDIFRIKTITDGIARYFFYDTDGNETKYDY